MVAIWGPPPALPVSVQKWPFLSLVWMLQGEVWKEEVKEKGEVLKSDVG